MQSDVSFLSAYFKWLIDNYLSFIHHVWLEAKDSVVLLSGIPGGVGTENV